ncbi:MAG: chemotaxis protein CheW, partial [Oscillospiraceae bacterium]
MDDFNNSNITAEDDLDGKYLTFFIGEATYGVELINVIEIISVQNITNVPGIPGYIKGIINLRGRIVPVIDVRTKIGLEERAYDERTCIIVISWQ